ncbi:BgTH12-05444 [Blumeria graminis f. sp. triticale]|uniref:BgTH12-05444 n=1 Tax=Blumeria graminis f. sp. triticale TaxID=1689686 RepID=A0A9W4D1F0_BLUGR|nr:BgTH12-05444 [Blumeria graminis f. sp. triticale]
MRFSCLAVVLQSASIFVTTLGAHTTRHIDEKSKAFDCGEQVLKQENYAGLEKSEITPMEIPLSWNLREGFRRAMEDTIDERIVLYGDSEHKKLKFFKLNALSKDYEEDNYIVYKRYYLILDQSNRVSGIIERKYEIYLGSIWQNPPREKFWMCKVGSGDTQDLSV